MTILIGSKPRRIRVHHDNASPHAAVAEAIVQEAAKEDGCDIQMAFQPSKSLDLNILDLGIFNAIQSVQYRQPTHDVYGLITAVMDTFEMLPSRTSDKCFITLQKLWSALLVVPETTTIDGATLFWVKFDAGQVERQLVFWVNLGSS